MALDIFSSYVGFFNINDENGFMAGNGFMAYLNKHKNCKNNYFFSEDLNLIKRFDEKEFYITKFGALTSPELISQNRDIYPEGFEASKDIELIVLHNTVCSLEPSYNVLTLVKQSGNVSSNFLVSMSGISYELVSPDEAYAWHAGASSWFKYDPSYRCMKKVRDSDSLNRYSVGIEIVNCYSPYHVNEDLSKDSSGFRIAMFTDEQVSAVNDLCNILLKEYPNAEICTHSGIAYSRKIDPMPSFPFEKIDGVSKLSDDFSNRLFSDLLFDDQGIESRKVLFEYNKDNHNSYDGVDYLRLQLMFLGFDIPLYNTLEENCVYDTNVARACWSFKSDYLGTIAPEFSVGSDWQNFYYQCDAEKKYDNNYFNDRAELNFDWQEGSNLALNDIVVCKQEARGDIDFSVCMKNTLNSLNIEHSAFSFPV